MTSLQYLSPGNAPGLPNRISVLVLDDMRFDRLKLARLCDTLPITCAVTQANCLSAFNLQLDRTAFDLIFVDYELPDGSGLDALELIRLSPRNCNAVSIMVTGFEESSIAFGAMTRGCADYITKDELSPSSFQRAVTNALQKSVLSAQVESQAHARIEVEAALNHFASQSISDIKPMLQRLVRQLRCLRENAIQGNSPLLTSVETAEVTCQSLSEIVAQLETTNSEIVLSDLPKTDRSADLRDVAPGLPARAPKKYQRHAPRVAFSKSKRPPSPFSGPTQ